MYINFEREQQFQRGWELLRHTKFEQGIEAVRNQYLNLKKQQLQVALDRERRQTYDINEQRFENRLVDSTTGCMNREYFELKLDQEVTRSKRYRRPMSLLIVMVDQLESIIDEYSKHAIEDTMALVSEEIGKSLRETDKLGRPAPHILAIMCPETDEEGARMFAERLVQSIQVRNNWCGLLDIRKLTVSIGVATVPSHAGDMDLLIEKCRDAAINAMNSGGNRYKVATSTAGNSVKQLFHLPGPCQQRDFDAAQPFPTNQIQYAK